MKSALSLALAACLVAPALRVSAQEQTTTAASRDVRDPASHDGEGPLARAASHAAAGLASVASPAKPAHSNWSRVRDIDPGTAIRLTVRGPQSGQRYFIAADDSSLTVGDRKIADRKQIVTKIARDDVAEITAMRRRVINEMLLGTAFGAGLGVVTGLSNDDSLASRAATTAVCAGVGAGVAAAFGATHKRLDVIYRAP
jgi:hypothetical protein